MMNPFGMDEFLRNGWMDETLRVGRLPIGKDEWMNRMIRFANGMNSLREGWVDEWMNRMKGQGSKKIGLEEYPVEYYGEFLEYVRERYEGRYWHGVPREMKKIRFANG